MLLGDMDGVLGNDCKWLFLLERIKHLTPPPILLDV